MAPTTKQSLAASTTRTKPATCATANLHRFPCSKKSIPTTTCRQKKSQLTILGLFGQSVYVKDSLPSRQWKITDNKRVISGYDCRKAIYQKNDTTRIYAWYTSALIPSVGPEGFCGLPGTILGLATEDGGIIYFAKTVELISPKKEDLDLPIGKNKVFSMLELRLKIEKEYGNTPWGKGMFDDLFRWL